jgi:hypothetical protein
MIYHREPFRPGAQLRARKAFECQGQAFRPGDVFDSTLVDERRLRQMYDSRWLDAMPSDDDRKPAEPSIGTAPRRKRGGRR